MSRIISPLGSLAGLALAALTVFTFPVFAQTDEATTEVEADVPPAAEGDAPAEPTTEAEAEAEAEPTAEAEADENQTTSQAQPNGNKGSSGSLDVRRLPLAAFAAPEGQIRGIQGGSMRLLSQGYQWPYLPAQADDPAVIISLSGSAWADFSHKRTDPGLYPTDKRLREWKAQSRLVLRATPTFNTGGGWFVQGQGEFVARGDQVSSEQLDKVDTDDLSIKAGLWDTFDVQVGRFQGWEVYHLGMGLDLNTDERRGANSGNSSAPGIYGLTEFWDRPSAANNIAGHYYPTDYLRFELLTRVGNDAGQNVFATRPVGILDIGMFMVKLGVEYGETNAREEGPRVCAPDPAAPDPTTAPQVCRDAFPEATQRRGAGAGLQFLLDPHVELGLNAARRLVDATNSQGVPDLGRSTDTTSLGAFANGRVVRDLVVGLGVNHTTAKNLKVHPISGERDTNIHLQAFGAVQYALWQQLYLKLVLAYAKVTFKPLSDNEPQIFSNEMTSARLRVEYLF